MLGSQCVEITKSLEGLYSKVLALKMESGEEMWAKVQNPKAGVPHYMVASEVATLDFVCLKALFDVFFIANLCEYFGSFEMSLIPQYQKSCTGA